MASTSRKSIQKAQHELFNNFHTWVSRKIFSQIEKGYLRDRLRETFDDKFSALRKVALTIKTREISTLDRQEVLSFFGLNQPENNAFHLEDIEGFEPLDKIPKSLQDSLWKAGMVISKLEKANESLTRMRFDNILIDALFSEMYPSLVGEAASAVRMEIDSQYEKEGELWMDHETVLNWHAVVDGATVKLSGRADYTIWYESDAAQMATNLVIVESKKIGDAEFGVNQCIGYMGCVHRLRQQMRKKQKLVYGFSTDGSDFHFLKIDENSNVYQAPKLSWKKERLRIYSGIRAIIRHANTLSPKQSRVVTGSEPPKPYRR